MADRIQLRRDTKANWEQYNPILLEGEPGHVLDYPNLYKMGDGVHTWNDLPYRGYNGNVTQEVQNDVNSVPSGAAIHSALKDSTKGYVDDEPTAGSDNLVKSGGITKFLPCARFIGKDGTLIESPCYLFLKNHTYTIYLNNTSWNLSSIYDTSTVFSVESYDSSNTRTYLVRCRKNDFPTTIKPSYTITIPEDSASVKICFRGDVGEELRVYITDITQINGLDAEINEISGNIEEIQDVLLSDIVDLSLYTPVNGYVDNSTGKWTDTTLSLRKHICIPLNNSSKTVTIHANLDNKAIVNFLSEYNVVEDRDAGMVSMEYIIGVGKIFSCGVPDGANYLYVQYNSNNLIYLPKSIYINSLLGQVEQNRTDISSIFNSYLNTKNILVQSLNALKDYSVLSVYKPDESGTRIYFKEIYVLKNAFFNIETNEGYDVALNIFDINGNMLYDSGWETTLTSDFGVLYNYQYAYITLVFRKSGNAATNLNDVIQNAVSELNIECLTQKYEDYLNLSLFNASTRKNTVRNIAHQGYSPTSNYGSNLAVNYINASKTGFDFGECDITFSSDGVAFCSHGIKVGNVWQDAFKDDNNMIVYFAENTAEQIKSHPYLGTTVSTFEEVIAACKSVGLGLYIDKISRIDTDTKWNTTFSVIKKYAMCDNVVFMPGNLIQAQKVFSIYPSAKVSILADLATAISIANQVKTSYNDVRIDVNYSDNTVAQIKEGYAQLNPGIGIDVYTIDNSTTFKEYLPYVSGITSNKLCEKNIS